MEVVFASSGEGINNLNTFSIKCPFLCKLSILVKMGLLSSFISLLCLSKKTVVCISIAKFTNKNKIKYFACQLYWYMWLLNYVRGEQCGMKCPCHLRQKISTLSGLSAIKPWLYSWKNLRHSAVFSDESGFDHFCPSLKQHLLHFYNLLGTFWLENT